MQIRFTETTLSSLSVPAGMRDHQWFDAALPGFGFRKFASGQAAYFVRYRIEQKQRKVTLSKYVPGLLGQMRRKAAEILADAKRGIDAQQEPERDLKFDEIIALYLEARRAELDPTWMKEVKRFLEQYWSRFHDRKFRSLERGELVRELDSIARARGAATADHSHGRRSGGDWRRGSFDQQPTDRPVSSPRR